MTQRVPHLPETQLPPAEWLAARAAKVACSELLFGTSPVMRRVLRDCRAFAPSVHPILIVGPPGTGKTVLAQYIHRLSGRRGLLVRCSMAGVPPHLEHSHLCGHRRGSFTGADRDQVGLIETAHLGSLFLDELGMASALVQGLLLDVVQEGTFVKVGETRPRGVDARILAATNADLEAMREAGQFRRDLFDRFGFLRLDLPPLRERRDEIVPLTAHYLALEGGLVGRREPLMLSRPVRDFLSMAPWEGNVREVRDLCRYLVLECREKCEVQLNDLPPRFLDSMGRLTPAPATRPWRERLDAVLARNGGNKAAAARELGKSRTAVYHALKQRALAQNSGPSRHPSLRRSTSDPDAEWA